MERGDTGRGEVPVTELARARVAYRGAQESARAWRAFTPNTRHHDMTYWSLLTSLFVEPGINRMTLIDKIIEFAGVSRSTAERAIREARQSGYVRDEPTGKEVRYYLSRWHFSPLLRVLQELHGSRKGLENLGHKRT
jgi:DNA-binding transcriptional ArsR family regulator